jgi:hypothetical protein
MNAEGFQDGAPAVLSEFRFPQNAATPAPLWEPTLPLSQFNLHLPRYGNTAAAAALLESSATAVPPVPAPNPEVRAVYLNVVPLGIAVTIKVPLYPVVVVHPVQVSPATLTLPPMTKPLGFAVVIVTVTVDPLSLADVTATGVGEAGLAGPTVHRWVDWLYSSE